MGIKPVGRSRLDLADKVASGSAMLKIDRTYSRYQKLFYFVFI